MGPPGHASGVGVTVAPALVDHAHANERHKWSALFITTLGMLMATIDASIVLIALPDIFRGIHLDPLVHVKVASTRGAARTGGWRGG